MANIDNMARQNMFEVDIYCPAIDLRLRGIRCQKAVLPGKNFEVAPFGEQSSGPNRSYITGVKFPQDIALTFICDNHFEDKMKIELWQEYMYSENYAMRYPRDFWGKVVIRQMDKSDMPIYEVELVEAFPQVIASQVLDMTSSAIQTFDVTFGYRTWVSSFEYPPENSILGAIFKRNKRHIISRVQKELEDFAFREDGRLVGVKKHLLGALIRGGSNWMNSVNPKVAGGGHNQGLAKGISAVADKDESLKNPLE
jgi:hypothetical protein